MTKWVLAVLCAFGLGGSLYSIGSSVISFRHLHQVGVMQQAQIVRYRELSSSHGSSLRAYVEYHVGATDYFKTLVVPDPADDPHGRYVRFQNLGWIPVLYDPQNPDHAIYGYRREWTLTMPMILALAVVAALGASSCAQAKTDRQGGR